MIFTYWVVWVSRKRVYSGELFINDIPDQGVISMTQGVLDWEDGTFIDYSV